VGWVLEEVGSECQMLLEENYWETFDELVTVLVKIEGMLNNRPLTYIYVIQKEGIHQPFTLADLIYGCRITPSLSDRKFEIVTTTKTLTRQVKYQFRILSNFTKQWQRNYLLHRKLRNSKMTDGPVVREGDIVILKEDGTT